MLRAVDNQCEDLCCAQYFGKYFGNMLRYFFLVIALSRIPRTRTEWAVHIRGLSTPWAVHIRQTLALSGLRNLGFVELFLPESGLRREYITASCSSTGRIRMNRFVLIISDINPGLTSAF